MNPSWKWPTKGMGRGQFNPFHWNWIEFKVDGCCCPAPPPGAQWNAPAPAREQLAPSPSKNSPTLDSVETDCETGPVECARRIATCICFSAGQMPAPPHNSIKIIKYWGGGEIKKKCVDVLLNFFCVCVCVYEFTKECSI